MSSKKIKINTLVFMAFLLGIILILQVKSVSSTHGLLTIKSIKEIEEQIEVEKNEILNLTKLIEQKNEEYSRYQNEINVSGSIVPVLNEKTEKLSHLSGKTELYGNGIIVEIRDSERELKEGENPNNIIVHDQDVLHIINDLKVAGAEAISVNDQRLIATSEVRCSGPTITINGKTFGQPFIIKATGPIDELKNTISSPDSYAYLLQSVYGIQIDYLIEDELIIPKYNKQIIFKYLKEEPK